MSFRNFRERFIVLNSAKAIKDLLEKRGNVYSDRPVIQFVNMWVSSCILAIYLTCAG